MRIRATSKDLPVRASRKPAALTGIILFALIGFSLIQGISSLQGQLLSSPNLIHIKQESIDPPSITVQPGDTVTWVNESTIPHVLTSDTLPTSDGKHFESSALFQGGSTRLLIPLNASPGTYTYISKTSKDIAGQIVINAAPAPVPASNPVDAPPTLPDSTPGPVPTPAPTSVPAPMPTTVLPQNAHTVGSGEAPLPPRQTGGQTADIVSHMPSSQSQTGPATWVTIAAALLGLLYVTRKQLKSVH